MRESAPWFILLIGIILLIYGSVKLRRYYLLRGKGIRAEGTVYEIEARQVRTEEGLFTDHYMKVGFITTQHKLIIHEIKINVNPYEYKKDDTIGVIYEESAPENFILDEGKSPAYTYFLLIFPAALCLITGVWMLLME